MDYIQNLITSQIETIKVQDQKKLKIYFKLLEKSKIKTRKYQVK